jgi:hypothetical protein
MYVSRTILECERAQKTLATTTGANFAQDWRVDCRERMRVQTEQIVIDRADSAYIFRSFQ